MYIFLAEASKIAYLYEDCHFYYFVNLNFFLMQEIRLSQHLWKALMGSSTKKPKSANR